MGERRVRNAEVMGSNPTISTKKQRMASLCILSGEIDDTKTSAENLFSLPICVIMVLTKSLPCVKGGGS